MRHRDWDITERERISACEDQAFVVEVSELPGCMADGPSYEEAVANAKLVIEEWIETAGQTRRPIPVPKGRLKYA